MVETSSHRSGRPLAARFAHFVGRTPTRGVAAFLAGAALLVASAGPAAAITDEEVYRTLDLGDRGPSARALGLGGAFIAVADDASTMYWNPAGLAYADRPQLTFDIRGTEHDDEGGSVPGIFTRSSGLQPAGVQPASGTVLLEDEDLVTPSFLAYVHPINEKFAIGVMRYERMNLERDTFTAFSTTSIVIDGAPGATFQPQTTFGELDLLLDTYSVSVGYAPNEIISLGLTLSLARLDIVASHDNFWYTTLNTDADAQQDVFERIVDYRTLVDDTDTAFTFTAGLLWQPHDFFRIGLVYRDGPEFQVEETILADGARASDLRAALVALDPTGTGRFINTFNFPDQYGIGLAFGPFFQPEGGGGLTISIDAVHVEYADLLEGLVQGLNNQLFGSGSAVGIEDQTEFHFGLGYSWTVGYNNSVHLRAGVYTREDGSLVRSPVTVATVGGGTTQTGMFFPEDFDGDAEVHVTLGAGFTLRRGYYAFGLDAAADISDDENAYVGSATFRF